MSVWCRQEFGLFSRPKYHAGASQLINRRLLSVGYRDPPYIKTNLSVPFLPFGQVSLYLLPDRILVFASKGIGAVAYNELNLSPNTTRFIEEGSVPPDAKIVDQTWRYVNKAGGPDRRFSNNRQIPICHYEELQITSSTGIHEILHLSRIGGSDSLRSAIKETVQSIQNAEAADRERMILDEQFRQQRMREAHEPTQRAMAPDPPTQPTPQMLHVALFDLLCCIMVADGRASTNEKAAIREVMTKTRSGWTEDYCNARIVSFIDEIKLRGFTFVLERSMLQIPMFQKSGRESTLLKCIDMVANKDGKASEREHELCNRIRKALLPPHKTTPNEALDAGVSDNAV